MKTWMEPLTSRVSPSAAPHAPRGEVGLLPTAGDGEATPSVAAVLKHIVDAISQVRIGCAVCAVCRRLTHAFACRGVCGRVPQSMTARRAWWTAEARVLPPRTEELLCASEDEGAALSTRAVFGQDGAGEVQLLPQDDRCVVAAGLPLVAVRRGLCMNRCRVCVGGLPST